MRKFFLAVFLLVSSPCYAYVSVSDFVPSGTITNYDQYIQAAINYSIANNVDLNVDKVYPITDHIVINRGLVDSSGNPIGTYDLDILTIFSNSHGGFSVAADNIGMFRTTLAYANNPERPVTENIRFLNLRFSVDDNNRASYVLKGTSGFLRTTFEHCSFEKIKLLACEFPSYLQSIYLLNCLATDWKGVFMYSQYRSFDLQIIGGRYEGTTSGDAFILPYLFGSKIWTQIESVSGAAIAIHGAKGVDVSCYFEANGVDITTTNAVHSSVPSADAMTQGVFVHGSKFSGGSGPNVIWGADTLACLSMGNMSGNTIGGVMHQVAIGADVTIIDHSDNGSQKKVAYIAQTGSYVPTLTCGTSGSLTLNPSQNTLAFSKIGNSVTVSGSINISDINAPSGSLDLSLPFPGKDMPQAMEFFAAPVYYDDINPLGAPATLFVRGMSGGSVSIREQTQTSFINDVANHMRVNSTLVFNFTYYTE